MYHDQGAFGAQLRDGKADPAGQIDGTLPVGQILTGVRRRLAAVLFLEGRVGHDMMKAAGGQTGRRFRHTAAQTLDHAGRLVQKDVLSGEIGKLRLNFQAENAATGDTRG